ncbi:MAG: hypothetical protein M3281_03250, partial [Chloroflexota bacterium]|nr:hypothetical protein [Chloroflexota bacterium]
MERLELTASDLWRLAGEGLLPWFQTLPGASAELSPHGWLLLSGEPVADLNFVYIDQGPAPDEQFRVFARVIESRGVPAFVLVAPAAASSLVSELHEHGLKPIGSMPLMVYQPDGAPASVASFGPYRIDRITEAADLEA